MSDFALATGNFPVRRGRSLLAREEDVHESGLSLFKRGATLRRKRTSQQPILPSTPEPKKRNGCMGDFAPGPKGPWMAYCFIITCWIPTPMMRACGTYCSPLSAFSFILYVIGDLGLRTRERQRAWREKMGLISLILLLMAGVGFLTFGFTEAVCGKPPNRFHGGAVGDDNIGDGSVVVNGYDYNFTGFNHPTAGTTFDGKTNPLFEGGWNLAGNDASFLFQNVNQNCLGLITKASSSSITGSGESLDWYFPCNVYNQNGTSGVNLTNYENPTTCHTTSKARTGLQTVEVLGQVYFTWDDVRSDSRNLAVHES